MALLPDAGTDDPDAESDVPDALSLSEDSVLDSVAPVTPSTSREMLVCVPALSSAAEAVDVSIYA
jgi:hypothetical protein